jgi:hypothetical protein
MKLGALGVSVDLPSGWEGRIIVMESEDGTPYPNLHAGNFGLRPEGSTFGQFSIQRMDPEKALVVMVEYGPGSVGTPLFNSGRWPPTVAVGDLNPANFPGPRPPGLAANQNFVTVGGRAFCVYVVMGFAGGTAPRIDEINTVLRTIAVSKDRGTGGVP